MEIPVPGQQSFHPVRDADGGYSGIMDNSPAYPRSLYKALQYIQKIFGFTQQAARR